MSSQKSKPTIHDVARVVGVSATTVSYVLNGRAGGKSRISDKTRKRILEAIDTLGYVQNDTARHLRRRSTDRICLILPRLGIPYYDILAKDIQNVANHYGYTVVISIGGSSQQGVDILNQVRGGLADGVMIECNHINGNHLKQPLEELVNQNIPAIVFNNNLTGTNFDVVHTTEDETIHSAISYLIKQGHRRIAHMLHSFENPIHTNRYDAYLSTLAVNNIPFADDLVVAGAANRELAYQNTLQLLKLDRPPTALITQSDISAVSAMAALHDSGMRIPEDMAVIGCGNIPEGQLVRPSLTTVGPITIDFTEIAQWLFDRLTKQSTTDSRLFIQEWQLIHRNSA